MQAFIYCRVSSEEQANDNHYSLENQETRGRGAHVKSTESGCNLGSLYDIIDSLVQDSSSQVCNGLYSRFFPA
ncbi:MAG: hypothetical protein ACYC64_15790, partial [Armatimonadota bacterium]